MQKAFTNSKTSDIPCAPSISSTLNLPKKFIQRSNSQKLGLNVTARGAARSNDAALNGGGIALDMSAMDQFIKMGSGHRSGTMRAWRHVGTTLAKSRAAWLVAAHRLGHHENHIGRVPGRKHSRQK